jgi:hypothetical protein
VWPYGRLAVLRSSLFLCVVPSRTIFLLMLPILCFYGRKSISPASGLLTAFLCCLSSFLWAQVHFLPPPVLTALVTPKIQPLFISNPFMNKLHSSPSPCQGQNSDPFLPLIRQCHKIAHVEGQTFSFFWIRTLIQHSCCAVVFFNAFTASHLFSNTPYFTRSVMFVD